jgi:hypothetical protein
VRSTRIAKEIVGFVKNVKNGKKNSDIRIPISGVEKTSISSTMPRIPMGISNGCIKSVRTPHIIPSKIIKFACFTEYSALLSSKLSSLNPKASANKSLVNTLLPTAEIKVPFETNIGIEQRQAIIPTMSVSTSASAIVGTKSFTMYTIIV